MHKITSWIDRKKLTMDRFPKMEFGIEDTICYKLLYRLLKQTPHVINENNLVAISDHWMAPIIYSCPEALDEPNDDVSTYKIGPIKIYWEPDTKSWGGFPMHHHKTNLKEDAGFAFASFFDSYKSWYKVAYDNKILLTCYSPQMIAVQYINGTKNFDNIRYFPQKAYNRWCFFVDGVEL